MSHRNHRNTRKMLLCSIIRNIREIRVQIKFLLFLIFLCDLKNIKNLMLWKTKISGRPWFRSSLRCSQHWVLHWPLPVVCRIIKPWLQVGALFVCLSGWLWYISAFCEEKRRKICVILWIHLAVRHYFRIFAAEFATLCAVLCRTKGKNYVYTRKIRLDKLPLGHFAGFITAGSRIP